MASSREFLDYVLGQLSGLDDISYRPMMGEYILYCQGRAIGGVYDDRLLLKPTPSGIAALGEPTEQPYDGAKPMLMPDVDDRQGLCCLIRGMIDELPVPKRRNRKK